MGRTRRDRATTRNPRRRDLLRRCERGAVALLVSAGLGMVGATVVALDVGSIRSARHHLHENAGGAALAALAELPDTDAARTAAFTYAAANDVAGLGTIETADDIEFGWWDPDADTFVPAGTGTHDVPVTAVRVTAHRAEVETNVGGVVAPVLGMETTDLTATEVASVDLTTVHFEGVADGPVPALLAAGAGTDLGDREGEIRLDASAPSGVPIGIVDLRCDLGCEPGITPFVEARHALVTGGGSITFDFGDLQGGHTTPWSVRLVGSVDGDGPAIAVMRAADGTVLDTQLRSTPPRGAETTWFFETVEGVVTLTIDLPRGGAIDDLRLLDGLTVVT